MLISRINCFPPLSAFEHLKRLVNRQAIVVPSTFMRFTPQARTVLYTTPPWLSAEIAKLSQSTPAALAMVMAAAMKMRHSDVINCTPEQVIELVESTHAWFAGKGNWFHIRVAKEALALVQTMETELRKLEQVMDLYDSAWNELYLKMMQQREALEGVRMLMTACNELELDRALLIIDTSVEMWSQAFANNFPCTDVRLRKASEMDVKQWWTIPAAQTLLREQSTSQPQL